MLNLLTTDLKSQSDLLKSRWTTGTTNSFYDDFKNAGQGTSSYATTSAALAEVLGSMVDIMTELPERIIRKVRFQIRSVLFCKWHFNFAINQ